MVSFHSQVPTPLVVFVVSVVSASLGKPPLYRATSGIFGTLSGLPHSQEHRQGLTYAFGVLVALEEVADLGACQAARSGGSQGFQYRVGFGIAGRVPEDVAGTFLGVLPQG